MTGLYIAGKIRLHPPSREHLILTLALGPPARAIYNVPIAQYVSSVYSIKMARSRVLLDEDIPDALRTVFPRKTQVSTVAEIGFSGKEDRLVIEEAVRLKSLIVTADKDFVPAYRKHDWRKGKDGRFFWGLIFLKPSKTLTQSEQLKIAIKAIDRQYDDIITVSATGRIHGERVELDFCRHSGR